MTAAQETASLDLARMSMNLNVMSLNVQARVKVRHVKRSVKVRPRIVTKTKRAIVKILTGPNVAQTIASQIQPNH